MMDGVRALGGAGGLGARAQWQGQGVQTGVAGMEAGDGSISWVVVHRSSAGLRGLLPAVLSLEASGPFDFAQWVPLDHVNACLW